MIALGAMKRANGSMLGTWPSVAEATRDDGVKHMQQRLDRHRAVDDCERSPGERVHQSLAVFTQRRCLRTHDHHGGRTLQPSQQFDDAASGSLLVARCIIDGNGEIDDGNVDRLTPNHTVRLDCGAGRHAPNAKRREQRGQLPREAVVLPGAIGDQQVQPGRCWRGLGGPKLHGLDPRQLPCHGRARGNHHPKRFPPSGEVAPTTGPRHRPILAPKPAKTAG